MIENVLIGQFFLRVIILKKLFNMSNIVDILKFVCYNTVVKYI